MRDTLRDGPVDQKRVTTFRVVVPVVERGIATKFPDVDFSTEVLVLCAITL